MSGGGKGGTETSSTTTNMPPPWAEGGLRYSAQRANRMYRNGVGFGQWEGPYIAGMSGATKQGLSDIKGLNYDAPGNLGYRDAIQDARKMYRQADNPIAGQGQLEAMANGDYLQDGNPYFRQQLDQGVSDLTAKLNSQFAGSGRYGSAANQSVVGQQAGNMLISGLSDNYDKERQAQLSASNMLLQRQQATQSAQQNALAMRMAAAQGLVGAQNTAFQNNLAAGNAKMQAGQYVDRRKQANLQAQINAFLAKENEPWTRLGAYQAALQGSAGNYGTSSSQGMTSQSMNPLGPLGLLGSFALK